MQKKCYSWHLYGDIEGRDLPVDLGIHGDFITAKLAAATWQQSTKQAGCVHFYPVYEDEPEDDDEAPAV